MKKALKILLCLLLVIVVTAVGTFHLALHSAGFRNFALNKALDGVLDARAGIGGLELSIGRQTQLVIRDVEVMWPKSSPKNKMLGIDSVALCFDAGKFFKQKQIHISRAHLCGIEAYLTSDAWDHLHFTPETDEAESGFTLPQMEIDDARIDIRKAVYLDMVKLDGFDLWATACVRDGVISAKTDVNAANAMVSTDDLRLRLQKLGFTVAVDQGAVPQEKKQRRKMRETPDFLSEEDFRAADLDFHLEDATSSMIIGWNPSATMTLESANLICGSFPMRTSLSGVKMRADLDRVDVDSLFLKAGSSDMALKGNVRGLRRFIFGKGGVLFSDLVIRSGNLDISEILGALGAQGDSLCASDTLCVQDSLVAVDSLATVSSVGKLFVVPANLVANIDLGARHLSYSDFDVKGFHTGVTIRERCILLSNVNARTKYGNLRADAFYSTRTKEDISAGFDLKLGKVTAENVMSLLPVVDEIVPGFSTFKGNMNFAIAAKTKLDTTMSVITPSMKGVFHIDGEKLSVDQTPQIRKITRWMLLKDKNVIDMHDLNINGVVSEDRVTIFPFTVTADRYKLLLSGRYGLSGGMDYRATLLKSPLLLRVGARAYGDDFSGLKFKLCWPVFKEMDYPKFERETAQIFKTIRTDVRNVLGDGVVQSMEKEVGIRRMRDARKSDFDRLELFNEMSERERKMIENMNKEPESLPRLSLDDKGAGRLQAGKNTGISTD